MDQFLQARSHWPRLRNALGIWLAASRRPQRFQAIRAAGQGCWLQQGRQVARRRHAGSQQARLLMFGQVRQQREIIVLCCPLHAELVVETAIALVGEVPGDIRERLLRNLVRDGAWSGDERAHLVIVGFRVGNHIKVCIGDAKETLGCRSLPFQPLLLALIRWFNRVRRATVEDADPYLPHGNAGFRKQRPQHLPIERHLQPVLDLLGRGRLHVGNQQIELTVRAALHPDDVGVAGHVPAADRDIQPDLEQHEHVTGWESALRSDQFAIVRDPPGGTRFTSQVARWTVLGRSGLHTFLEFRARAGEQRQNFLRRHPIVAHEVRANGTLMESQPQKAPALVKPNILRNDCRRNPPSCWSCRYRIRC